MPYQRRASYGRRRNTSYLRPVNSMKNVVNAFTAQPVGTGSLLIARAVDSATNAVTQDVERGCNIKAIWLEIWIYDSAEAAVGVTSGIDFYIWKDPGANLTPPIPGTEGSSNEKKFIFKSWKGLTGARTQGSPPYAWRGWIKIPKRYQRMGTDDLFELQFNATGVNKIVCTNLIYKWYK